MLGQHIEKCAEQADNRELRKKGRKSLFSSSVVLFVDRIILEARHV